MAKRTRRKTIKGWADTNGSNPYIWKNPTPNRHGKDTWGTKYTPLRQRRTTNNTPT